MAGDNPSDTLPIMHGESRGFDQSMRGYDRQQVDSFVRRADRDLHEATGERDAALNRSADLAAQLASAQAQVESLRRQVRTAAEQVTVDNVDSHVTDLLGTARAAARKIRDDADAAAVESTRAAYESAERTRSAARTEADQLIAQAKERQADADQAFRQRMAQVERHREEVEARLRQDVELTRHEQIRLTDEATAERDRLDAASLAERIALTEQSRIDRTRVEAELARLAAESLAARTRLEEESLALRTRLEAQSAADIARTEEDFEITLRARRTDEARIGAERAAAADASARQRIAEATATSTSMVAAARDEVARLAGERAFLYEGLTSLHARLGNLIRDEPRPPAVTPDGG